MAVVTVGIDLAKNVFAVHGVDKNGNAVLVKPKSLPACHPALLGWKPVQALITGQGFSSSMVTTLN